MGRTIPSFRMATVEEIKDWKEFRNRPGKYDMKLFDRIYAICQFCNSAGMYDDACVAISFVHRVLQE